MQLIPISIRADVRALEKTLTALERQQIPFAASQTANRLARRAIADIQAEEKKVFDRPTPYALNAWFWTKATKRSMTAEVRAKEFAGKGNPAWKFLGPEAFGGARRMKRFERALKATLGEGFTIPGRGAKLNQFGNISPGDIAKILSALGAAEQTGGYRANRTARSAGRKGRKLETYFLAHGRDGAPLGIYKVVGPGHVEPVLVFAHHAPRYSVRLPYDETVTASMRANARPFLADEMQKALATAR